MIENALIAPNDINQYGRITTALFSIGIEPLLVQHAQCPIGRHYVLRANTTAVASPILAPALGIGVQAFA